MQRIHLALVLAVTAAACAALRPDGASAQEARGAAGAAATDDLRRDVEVMRRVLAKEALGATQSVVMNHYGTELSRVYWSGGRYGTSEAYVVAGDGVTFLLRTSDPVAPARGVAASAGAPKEPSAWEEAEADLDGRPRTRPLSGPDRYDESKVEALRQRVLGQLASFGHKIRGLSSSDHITVIVQGGPAAQVVAVTDRPAQGTAELATRALFVDALVQGREVGTTVLTIRVSIADCQAAARGDLDAAGFRGRASVSAY